ncbi:MAG: hypothetical protein K2L81_01015, partial [Muribaculaceae bacterium]|nr:hypothetical protein [Muribaculaceae bacterium]
AFAEVPADDPTMSPLCFATYDERYSCEKCELHPDTTVAITWPVVPSRGYVEVRGAVKGNGDCHGESRQRWGVKWTNGNGVSCRVALSWGNTDFGDFTDRRYLRADIIENDSIVDTHYYYKDVDLYDGPNTLALDFTDGKLGVSVGSRHLADSFTSTQSISIPDSMEVWTVEPLMISSVVARSWPDYAAIYPPQWTYDDLYERIAGTTDPMEAFWSYFDRNTGETTQIGGRYLLATVACGDGYDIVMVDGARVNQSMWACGTVKGRLLPSIFIDTYTLGWRDATGRWMHRDNDLTATVANSSLLTLHFPNIGATLRFSRMPLSQLRRQKE